MKFFLGIVLYNPEPKSITRIEHYINSGIYEKVIVYDNSDHSEVSQPPDGVVYLRSGKNDGLSLPYNKMLCYANANECDFLCLLDQDSNYETKEMQYMIEYIINHYDELDKMAVLAPRVYIKSSSVMSLRRELLTDVRFAINSGTFLNLKCLKREQLWYDEKIFLDGVDWDFCWSARQKGCRVVVYENSVFHQNMGYLIYESDFTHHASFRYYYIAHNKKYIYLKHMGLLRGTVLTILGMLSLLYKVIRYEENRKEKLIACFKGITS